MSLCLRHPQAPESVDSQAGAPPPQQAKEEPDGAHQGEGSQDKAKPGGAVSLFDSVEALGEAQTALEVGVCVVRTGFSPQCDKKSRTFYHLKTFFRSPQG